MDMTIIIAFSSVIAAIGGAFLHFLFSNHSAALSKLREMRTEAYKNYIEYVCNFKRKNADKDESKAQICLYGSNGVVKYMADFKKIGANLNDDESIEAF